MVLTHQASKIPVGQKSVEVNGQDGKLILLLVRTLAQTEIQGISIALWFFFARASGARFLLKWRLSITMCYEGNYSECIKCLNKLLKIDPHHFRYSIWNDLVHLLFLFRKKMSIFYAKMIMPGTFSIMPGTPKPHLWVHNLILSWSRYPVRTRFDIELV